MRRTLMSIVCLFAVAVMVTGCGKYSDAKREISKLTTACESFADDVEKAENADDAAKAINTFADKMEKIAPRMDALTEKYPELKDDDEVPEELEECKKAAEKAGERMMKAMMKMMEYMGDEGVQKAQERLGKVMENSTKK